SRPRATGADRQRLTRSAVDPAASHWQQWQSQVYSNKKGTPMELKGCAAIVTGGSGGLGERICHALANNGVNVVVNYTASAEQAKSIAAEMSKSGARAIALQADVTDVASVNKMVDKAKAEFGRVDILVNDAAFNKSVPFPELDGLTHDLWDHIIKTNLYGPFN